VESFQQTGVVLEAATQQAMNKIIFWLGGSIVVFAGFLGAWREYPYIVPPEAPACIMVGKFVYARESGHYEAVTLDRKGARIVVYLTPEQWDTIKDVRPGDFLAAFQPCK